MDSVPPHSVTFPPPSRISWAPDTMAWKPEPHSRLSGEGRRFLGYAGRRPT